MRICFVIPPRNLSGGIRVVAIYAERLMARGHEVRIVEMQPERPPLREMLRRKLRGQASGFSTKPKPSHFDDMDVDIIPYAGPDSLPDGDILSATFFTTAPIVAEAPAAKGAKIYFIQHYEVFSESTADQARATWRLPLHKITISQWLVDIAREEFGDEDVTLVHNSVDTNQFHAEPRGKNPAPVIGMLYHTTAFKSCHIAFAAFEKVRAVHPAAQLIAFGAHEPTAELPLPEGTEYHLRPPQETIRSLYARCDLWLCGSMAEGFHLPPLEAMACGCPVVSTKVGGSVDVVNEGENGYLAEVGDADGLADGMLKVLALDDAGWRRMSQAAFERAYSYTWDDATDRLLEGFARGIAKQGER